jgi:hypothetical protein
MTVKEFVNLAVILLLGLMVNHCAFHKDVSDFSTAGKLEKVDQRLQDSADKFDQRMEKASQEIEQKMEHLDQKMNEAGDRIDETVSGTSNAAPGLETTTTKQQGADGQTSLSMTTKLPGTEGGDKIIFMQLPAELLIVLGEGEAGKLKLDLSGSGVEAPDISNNGGRVDISFAGETTTKAQAAFPQGIAELLFGEDEAVRLTLEPTEAVLHLDSAVEKLNIKRSGDWVTLSHQDWSVRIKGLTIQLRVVDADGAELGKLDAGKASELSIVLPGAEGGAE